MQNGSPSSRSASSGSTRRVPGPDDPLRIAYLTYRGKPHVGGQGVYTRHLTKALVDLGHHAEVLSGQPYPIVDERVPLVELPSLDIYNDYFPMRMPAFWELKDRWDWAEVTAFSTGTFPEPLAFSLRAWDHLKARRDDFDLVQDNQCLGYGLLMMERMGLPVLGTIHHPITMDRRLEMEHADTAMQRWSKSRWYAFTKMQTRVAKRLRRVITVSRNSYDDICRDHMVSPEKLFIVPVGVDPELFVPIPGIERNPNQIISTASSDVAMKGQRYLLGRSPSCAPTDPTSSWSWSDASRRAPPHSARSSSSAWVTRSSSSRASPTSASSSCTTSRPARSSRRCTRASRSPRSRP